MSLFATKTIESLVAGASQPTDRGLRRVLGRRDLVGLGVGAVIGAGIFVLTGQAAAAHAGPAIVLSMAIAGLVSALAGLCYAEFASTVPVSGSAYTYAYATLGEIVAWMIGWDLVLEYALGAATVAVSWSGHFSSFLGQLGLQFPAALSAAPGTTVTLANGTAVTAVFNLPAVLITIVVTALLLVGVRESTTMNTVMVAVKVGVILIVIAGGIWFVQPSHWHPFVPPNTGHFGEYGWSGILRGAAVIFFAFIGFDAVSTTAQEARAPQRDMPIGILGSLAICTLLYMLVSGVMVGLVPYRQMLGSPAPMIVVLDAAGAQAPTGALHALVGLMKLLRGNRGPRRTHERDARDDARAAPDLPCDGARRPSPRMGGAHPSQVAHAARDDARHGRARCGGVRVHGSRDARSAREHRHPLRVRRRVDRRSLPARTAAGDRAAVPGAIRAAPAAAVDSRLPGADGEPAAGHVGAPGDLDDARPADLRHVRVSKQQAAGGCIEGDWHPRR
jgi:hypothetical protein